MVIVQSRTNKVDNKNKVLLVPPEIIGIDSNPFKEPPGQFSAHSIEPFSFKLPFKESVLQIMAEFSKKTGKIRENCAIAFFFEEKNNPKVWKKFIEPQSSKKIRKFHCPNCESPIIRDMAKKKLKRNITGLRNQSKAASHVEEASIDNRETVEIPAHSVIDADQDNESDSNDGGWDAHTRLDTNKLFWGHDDDDEGEDSDDEVLDGDEGDVEDEVVEAGEDE